MTILCTIDLETREVSIPSGQCIAAYDHNVDVIRFQAEAIPGFSLNTSSIKIAAQGPNKSRHDYAVDPSTVTIEEETGYITFDWPIPAGVTEMPIGTFKYGDRGQLIFAVCAEIISGSTVSKAWHSDDGIITVVAHLEPESGGGEDPEEEATNAQKIAQLQTNVAVMGTQIGALANGSPTPVATVAEMTDESAVYLYTGSETGYTAGNWYYYNGSAWTSGGTYGGAVTDTTLSVSGAPADSKAVGDALADKADADDVDAIDDRVTAVEGDIDDLLDDLNKGTVPLYGQLVQGFYPIATGTMGANANARMMVFPIANSKKYLISWLSGANKYRTAFGNTKASNISASTEIYDYTDNGSTTHEDYPKINSGGYKYLYVYIGNTSSATELSCKVKTVLSNFDSCFASDGDTW